MGGEDSLRTNVSLSSWGKGVSPPSVHVPYVNDGSLPPLHFYAAELCNLILPNKLRFLFVFSKRVFSDFSMLYLQGQWVDYTKMKLKRYHEVAY